MDNPEYHTEVILAAARATYEAAEAIRELAESMQELDRVAAHVHGYIYYPFGPNPPSVKEDEPITATAGEDMRRGDVLALIPEGEDKYAYRVLPERKGIKSDGFAERDAKKGESVKVLKQARLD